MKHLNWKSFISEDARLGLGEQLLIYSYHSVKS